MIAYGLLKSCCIALVGHQLTPQQAYKDWAASNPQFEAACLVQDKLYGGQQSGVLIAPNLVLTAAHGLIRRKVPKGQLTSVSGIYVYFMGQTWREVEVTGLWVHPDYDEEYGLHDVAILKLSRSVIGINPAILVDDLVLPSNAYLSVITYGLADVLPGQAHPGPRGLVLTEWDRFSRASLPEQKYGWAELLYSSIFFSPNEQIDQSKHIEARERHLEGFHKWIAINKPPHGLALAGSSGAPIFAHIDSKLVLLGIVTAFAPLAAETFQYPGEKEVSFLLTTEHKFIYDRYQTIFWCLYEQKLGEDKEDYIFRLSPEMKNMITILNSTVSKELRSIEQKLSLWQQLKNWWYDNESN